MTAYCSVATTTPPGQCTGQTHGQTTAEMPSRLGGGIMVKPRSTWNSPHWAAGLPLRI